MARLPQEYRDLGDMAAAMILMVGAVPGRKVTLDLYEIRGLELVSKMCCENKALASVKPLQ